MLNLIQYFNPEILILNLTVILKPNLKLKQSNPKSKFNLIFKSDPNPNLNPKLKSYLKSNFTINNPLLTLNLCKSYQNINLNHFKPNVKLTRIMYHQV